MAISIPVAATADDRSMQRVAGQYEKWGKDTGRKIGDALADGIDDPKLEKAFSKVGDAMSKVRAEEAKLQALRDKGAANSRIVQQSEALARARSAEVRATNDAVRAYDALASKTSNVSNATGLLRDALAGTRFGAIAGQVETLASKFGGVGLAAGGAVAGVAAIGVAAVAAGKALYELGAQWDSVSDGITWKTGKIGDDLDKVIGSVKRVASETAAPIEQIGKIAADLDATLGLTGKNLEDVTQQIAILDSQAGNPVGVRDLADVFKVFNVEADKQSATLDQLFSVSQATNIPMQQLVSTVASAGVATKQFGLDAAQTAGVLGSFERAGLNGAKTTQALTFAFNKFSKEGKDAQTELVKTIEQIQALSDAHKDDQAAALASATFGRRAYLDFFEAIKSGRVDVEQLTKSFETNGSTIKDTADKTSDLTEQWSIFTNNLKTLAAPQAEYFFGMVNMQVGRLIDGAKQAKDVLGDLFGTVQAPSLDDIGAGGSGNGPHGGFGDSARNAAGAPILGGQLGNPLGSDKPSAPYWGYPDTKSGSGSTPKTNIPLSQYGLSSIPLGAFPGETQMGLPGRVEAPHTGPGSYVVDPQKVFDSETSRLSAQQRLEDARLRVLELQSKNDATAQEIQSAKDQLLIAERGYLKAQQDVLDAQQGTWKKLEDSAKQFSDGMDSIGAALDNDFGISKGLPGIAENITKFLANLAFAPVIGALKGVQAASGYPNGAAGSGLFGIMGSSMGMAGPPSWAQGGAASSGAVYYGGGSQGGIPGVTGGGNANVNAMLALAQASSGKTAYAPASDLINGLADCSGSISDLYEVLTTGTTTSGRKFTTTNFASDAEAAKLGFLPGYSPGDLNVGVNPYPGQSGHMAATLPNGVNFEGGGGTGGGAQYGGSASGALDPQFEKRYHFPIGGGGVPAAASPSAAAGGGGWSPSSSAATAPAAGGGGWLSPSSAGSTPGSGGYAPLTPGQLTNPGLTSPVPLGTGGAGTGAVGPGLGGPPQSPAFAGPATDKGGREFGMGTPASGGIGFGGGLIGLAGSAVSSAAAGAASAGAMGMDGGAGGAVASAVAQIGIQEAQRAAAAAGQYAGVAIGGLLETFSLNESPLADPGKSWLGRIAMGVAGARPAMPNAAGGKGGKENEGMAQSGKEPPPPDPNDPNAPKEPPGPMDPAQQGKDGQKPGQGGNTINNNVNVTNNGASENQNANTITAHLGAMSASGMVP